MGKSKNDPPIASQVAAAFAARLVRLRNAREWSVKDAAAAIGIQHWRLRKYEEAKREPPLWLIIRIAEAYEVSVSFLLLGQAEVVKFTRKSS